MADNYEIEVTLEETFGTGIRSVEQTGSSSVSGGLNEITVTLTNDQENKFYIMNGEKGADGRDGSSPIAVTSADQMTDTSQIYLYGGSEEGYIARHLYYWNGSEWADYGLYGMPDTYLSSASIDNETALDEHGNTVSTSRILGITGRILSNPAYYEFVQKLYSVSGENEDGALTQKATSEAIEAAQFLPILNHPIAPVGDNILSVTLEPNVLNQISGIGYTFTDVTLVLNGAKANTLTRYFVRFTTGGNAVTFAFPSGVTVPSGFSLKTQTTYDIVIENNVAHIWEDGNAVGNVLDATATADAVADWLDDHPEATTTVADGSITTAKLATGVIDNTLLVSGAAADSAKVGQELSDLKSQLTNGIPYAVKVALNHIIQNVAFKNDTDYSADKATINTWATSINVTSINVVYEQSGTVYTTDSLDVLRDDLTVTAYYDNGTSAVVNDYTLSGELTEGESTIVVAYGGKASSITVTVTTGLPSGYEKYDYVFNIDKTGAQNLNALIDTATYSDWNALTIEWTAAVLSTMSGSNVSLGGYRPATAWADGKAIYALKDGAGALACSHGTQVGDNSAGVGGAFSTDVPHVFKIIEASQSPSKFQIDDGTPVDIAWTNTTAVNGKAQFFRNVATNASNWYTNSFVQLGTLVIKDLNGDLVGKYVPCKRIADNVIGFYDTVTNEFHTARTATYATVGNSNCMYSVGNWS